MNNLNSVLLEGNLVRDPEKVLVGSNGSVMGRFSIAVNRYYKNAKAEAVEEVMYIGVQVWGGLAEGCLNYLKKGRGVRVVGRLRQERWTDKDGDNREKILVVAEHVEFKPENSEKVPDLRPEEEMPFDEEVSL
ncbi:single-stranded DNA-binding protein [Sphaerochaeta sp. PS]|uniref:single-stranded DNA-binding protein n=1 Tax=Sphaerochaeta sp. PS TaxID=3076336 RepID=UPI0028A49FE0|nr:single-stranded DNA-binding protein [Sphaerochaeta sp. PS]MDT4762313.1 single-stranded DNA-binding protein [Sphaerochaeta sp. PS]